MLGRVSVEVASPVIVTEQLTKRYAGADFLAVDRYGQQYLRADPILWLGFGKYESAHPTKD